MGGCAGVPVPAVHAQRSLHAAACPSLVSAGCSRLAVSMRSVSLVSSCLSEIPRHSHRAMPSSTGMGVGSASDSECWAVSCVPLLNEEKHFVSAQLRNTELGSQVRVASGWVCAGVSQYTQRSCS